MNILYLTQSNTLELFNNLSKLLVEKGYEKNSGYIISDSKFYHNFLKLNKTFEKKSYLIKEWEITKNLNENLDLDCIKNYEKELNVLNFWDAIVSDRRLLFGENFTFRQDYYSKLNYNEIHLILSRWLKSIDLLFHKFKPNLIVSFISTYLGEYITYLFAKKNNIPYFNLRPTRVENYMHFGLSPNEPSLVIKRSYENFLMNYNINNQYISKSNNYLINSRKSDIKYEGVFLANQKPPQSNFKFPNIIRFLKQFKNIIGEEYYYRINKNKCDRHLPGYFKPILYRKIYNPILVKKINYYLNDKYVDEEKLKKIKYAFFPLHIEPEVTLLVYSKPYINQIEVIRNLAYSLPAGVMLVVKEHPAAVGKRPLTFYKKLLNISNVLIVKSTIETRILIKNSLIVTTIAGSVGFESIILKKPVLIFGNTPYEFLPDTMVKKVNNINFISNDISYLLNNYKYEKKHLISYVSSIYKNSIDVNFYSVLIRRSSQFMYNKDSDYNKNLEKLSLYLIEKYKSLKKIN